MWCFILEIDRERSGLGKKSYNPVEVKVAG